MKQQRPRNSSPPTRTVFEAAAIAMCDVINGAGRCACEHSPSVCDTMVIAARVAVRMVAPDVMAEIEREEQENAFLSRRR